MSELFGLWALRRGLSLEFRTLVLLLRFSFLFFNSFPPRYRYECDIYGEQRANDTITEMVGCVRRS